LEDGFYVTASLGQTDITGLGGDGSSTGIISGAVTSPGQTDIVILGDKLDDGYSSGIGMINASPPSRGGD
jgi:hypothetical protein